ncbi:MAG TPA: phosphopyruvate hydratase [Nocardioidaceae bacterium]|nr:phosphopyruvate hydratase [Nocardioidaceae bacterium]
MIEPIGRVHAWEALDSRGTPTIGCEVTLADGVSGECVVPSGASTGTHEAHELRDGGQRYGGRGTRHAVGSLNSEVAPALVERAFASQEQLDRRLRELDGTDDCSRLGGNAMLAVSIAFAIATANSHRIPLHREILAEGKAPLIPLPMVNIFSGGAHAGRSVDLQDFLAVPVGAASFSEAINWAWRVRAGTAEAMRKRGLASTLVADEGGLSAALTSNREAIALVVEGIHLSGLRPGDEVGIAVDVAANQLLDDEGRYALASEHRSLTAAEWISELTEWLAAFPIVSLEDPLGEDDWSSWRDLTKRMNGVQLLGDDLFVTSRARLDHGIQAEVANAVLIKPNQIGTLSDAHLVLDQAKESGYQTVISARSGDTEDAWLSEFAMGWRTGQIKVGSTTRSERTAKWNRLLKWESMLGDSVEYAGGSALTGTSS